MERKNFLKKSLGIAGIGAILFDACSKDATTSETDSGSSASGDCVVTPSETEGPYPYPQGEIKNPLNRADITDGQTGVPLTLTLTVVNANNNCAVVENARVDIWHCNKDGYYSGYANQQGYLGTKSYTSETFLRGYLTTDASGEASFKTIYPGWYNGRATHIHIEVYVDSVMKKTTQLAFPESINNTVYESSLYSGHGDNPVSNTEDNILGDSEEDFDTETATVTGDATNGYIATLTVGIEL